MLTSMFWRGRECGEFENLMFASQFQKLGILKGEEIGKGGNQVLAIKQENSTEIRVMKVRTQS